MASSAQLAIAKASLLAALLKPDPEADLPACSRDEIEQFHGLFSAAVARCSPANVQKCKQWLLQHLVRSRSRTAPWAKYLLAYANSLDARQQHQQHQQQAKETNKPSARRRRLHVLYVLNDVFHHVKSRAHTNNETTTFFADIEPHLASLCKSAASFEKAPKHEKKLFDLVQLWQDKAYFAEAVINQLRTAIAEGPKAAKATPHSNGAPESAAVPKKGTSGSSSRDAPFMLPSMHGDPSTPWYDLPAANWLPFIEPNSTRPMNPSMIRPLQLAGGPPDKSLVMAVKKLLGEVDKVYAEDIRSAEDENNPLIDISQMGEMIERDEMGDIVGGETYYGWSRAFCEKMKARRRGGGGDAINIDRDRRGRSSRSSSRSRSRSRDRSLSSRSSSRPVFKRRRLSESRSRSPSRSRSRTPRSRTRNNRSRSGGGGRTSRNRRRSYSRSRSRSRGGSYSPLPGLGGNPTPPIHDNSNGGGPPNSNNNFFALKPQPHPRFNNNNNNNTPPPPPPNFPGPGGLPPNFLPPTALQHFPQQQQGGWNVPPPPPPPPQYQGHWPPPPPPPQGMHGAPVPVPLPQPTNQGWFSPVPPPHGTAGSPPPPPAPAGAWPGGWTQSSPPPPPQQQQGGYGGGYHGRGGNGNRGYRGRGNGGYGRGGRGW